MGLADTIGDVLGGVAQAAPDIIQGLETYRHGQRGGALGRRFLGVGNPYTSTTGAGNRVGDVINELLGVSGDVVPVTPAAESPCHLWEPTRTGVRPMHEIQAVNPITGRLVTWVNRGRPILYSGDVSAARRAQRIASTAARRLGGGRRRMAAGPFRRRRRC